jgi:hypothetical protein
MSVLARRTMAYILLVIVNLVVIVYGCWNLWQGCLGDSATPVGHELCLMLKLSATAWNISQCLQVANCRC